MATPSEATYSVAALAAAHQALADLIDAGSGPGFVRVRDSSDTLLAEIPLPVPCGTVDSMTGQLEFDVADARDDSAAAGGSVAYAEFCNGDGDVHLAIPAQQGTTANPGFFVMNTLTVVMGGPVQIMSATIG